jgi:hypothetical protein
MIPMMIFSKYLAVCTGSTRNVLLKQTAYPLSGNNGIRYEIVSDVKKYVIGGGSILQFFTPEEKNTFYVFMLQI